VEGVVGERGLYHSAPKLLAEDKLEDRPDEVQKEGGVDNEHVADADR